ncbi:MAG: T9SS type A sorting domain-containing protein, partial [Candidatus Eisenbacteria sp.]|nr:T9SS type A sorting domain-containing protein [Candidatus Eisenbacteria bacterium]
STIYVSTFDYESGGTGIYKTEDSGATWQSLGWPGEAGTPPGPIWCVSRLHISAEDPGRLIAGSGSFNFGVTGAIYETDDGGADWNSLRLSGVPDISHLRTQALEPLSLRQDTVFLGADHYGGPDEIFYSVDSGRGWRVLVEEVVDYADHGFDIATDDSMRVYYSTGSGITRSSAPRDPSIVYTGHVVDDSVGGNGDGHVDPGETVSIDIALRNMFGNAVGISATLSTPDVFVSVTQSYSSYPNLVWGGFGTPLTSYQFEVDEARRPGPLEFALEIVAERFSASEIFFVDPRILVVDDDDFGGYESSYTAALEDNHLAYRRWSIVPDGPVTEDLLADHGVVVWFTSAMQPGVRGTTLSADEELLLAQYLDGGGRLLLSSQDYLAETSGGPPSEFGTGYLHVAGYFEDSSRPGVVGVPGDPIGDGVLIGALDYPFANLSDTVFPDSLAARVLNVAPGVGAAAIRFPSVPDTVAFRTVFLAFPFEAIPDGGEPPSDRATIMRRAIEWLVPEGGLVPTGMPDGHESAGARTGIAVHCSPNPAQGSVRLTIDCAGTRGEARVSVYDIAGRLVWSSNASNGNSGASTSIVWSCRDERGERVSSGVYLVRVSMGGHRAHTKVVLLR